MTAQIVVRQRGVTPARAVLKRAIQQPATRRKAAKHIGYTSAQGATPEEVAWFAKHGANEVVSELLAQDGLSREVFFSRIYTLEKGDVVYLLDLAHVPDQFRANLEAQGVKIVVIGPAPAQAQATKRDPFIDLHRDAVTGRKSEGPARVVKFAPLTGVGPSGKRKDPLAGAWLGLKPKAEPQVIGYVRDEAPSDPTFMNRFRALGASEVRREARSGRGVLKGILFQMEKGSTLILERLTDLAVAQDLPSAVKAAEDKGITLVSLDGANSKTEKGRGFIAMKTLAARQLFGLRL